MIESLYAGVLVSAAPVIFDPVNFFRSWDLGVAWDGFQGFDVALCLYLWSRDSGGREDGGRHVCVFFRVLRLFCLRFLLSDAP